MQREPGGQAAVEAVALELGANVDTRDCEGAVVALGHWLAVAVALALMLGEAEAEPVTEETMRVQGV